MPLIKTLFAIAEIILLCYFLYVVLYTLVLAIAGKFRLRLRSAKTDHHSKIAILIPAYKEDGVIYETAANALLQNYPKDKFEVVVIADQLKATTVSTLKQLPIQVVEVSFEKSTKVNSLRKAMEVIGNEFEIGLVLDADNLMELDFISKINEAFNAGYKCIQAQRRPKNFNTRLAVLDGLSEDINNQIYRKGTAVMRGSSAIVGSGFAVEYATLRETIAVMNSVGGFDKELEIKLLERGIKTTYLEQAELYDEKVAKSEVFINQRKRWISSQYYYLRKYSGLGFRGLLKGNFSLFNSTVLRYIQLPRLLNLGLLFLVAALAYFVRDYLLLPFWIYPLLFALLAVAIAICIPPRMFSRQTLKAILILPGTFISMLSIMFRLKGANRTFIHTPHGAETKK